MWCDDVDVSIETSKCPTLYVSNKSKLNLSLGGCNSITIYLFDESEVDIDDADETCNILVYKYSDDAKVVKNMYCLCDIKEFRKQIRL